MVSFVNSYNYPWDIPKLISDNKGKSGVYLILNDITFDFFIGSAISENEDTNHIYIRFLDFFFDFHKVSNMSLKNSMKKYGKSNFSFHIIAYSDIMYTKILELQYIQILKPTLNFIAFGKSSSNYKYSKYILWKIFLNYRINNISLFNEELFSNIKTKKLSNIPIKKTYTLSKSDGKIHLQNFVKFSDKPVSVYCGSSGNLIKNYNSVKDLWRNYKYSVSYRTIRRHLKSGLPIKKLNIFVKYDS